MSGREREENNKLSVDVLISVALIMSILKTTSCLIIFYNQNWLDWKITTITSCRVCADIGVPRCETCRCQCQFHPPEHVKLKNNFGGFDSKSNRLDLTYYIFCRMNSVAYAPERPSLHQDIPRIYRHFTYTLHLSLMDLLQRYAY